MSRPPLVAAALLALVGGCGPSASELRQRTLSALNTEADRWDGGSTFDPTAADAYGHPLTARVEKHTLSYELTLRSAGPDGLPQNSDDITVTRSRRHGEATVPGEAGKAAEKLAEGLAGGTIQGVRKGLGLGGKAPTTRK